MKHEASFITFDPWLAKQLGVAVYKLSFDKDSFLSVGRGGSSERLTLEALLMDKIFAYCKVETSALEQVSLLEELGFRLVDTNVLFSKELGAPVSCEHDFSIRHAKPEDRDDVVKLARESFHYSRFHVDKMIPNKTADEIKAVWVDNYFLGKRGDSMLVAEVDGELAGFVTLLFDEEAVMTIDLIAVRDLFRHRGISSGLISRAESEFSKYKRFKVGTQVLNIPSVRLYEKCGFRLEASHYVFHYHG